ncbi:hypothetical protein QFC19_001934 [Naganishia cerealis]|uniref:Uncharacterized protein n=1 Tax=Naganishia cerealis TaxID=610337 RepID=A0ACC2WD82_9TREE|nr:hypothetical protein QFC19_001934 [Naganishia cerealis]
MEGSPWPRGQKRPLENTDSGEYAAKHIGATTLEDYSPDQEQSHNVDSHQYGTSSPFQGKNISTSHEADSSMSTKRPIPSGSSSKVDGRSNLNDEHQRHGVNEPLWKKIKVNITRQGSAPPRLELAFDSSSAQTSNTNTGTLLALDRGNKEGIQSNEIKLNTAIQQVKKEKEHVSERMERLLDDLETEVTCGLCAGVFIDSYQPSTRMAYTNPFPALNEYMRRMRDMAIARYEDGYDSSSSAESDYMVRPRRIGHHLDEGSDVEDDYAPPVNPHNYYELAIFILYCIKRNQAESSMNMDQTTIPGSNNETSSTSRQKITMVDIIKATVARNMDDGGLKGIFERANKAWPWVSPDDPERLCKFCVNVMLEASIFEWWMKEVIKPEVAAQLPLRQPDCKYGRSCAFQENPKHAQSFSHLCERLSESDFMASTQPTPLQETSVDAEVSPNPETLLRRAIIHSGPAFNLPGLTMEDLHWQNGHYSGINRAAMENAVVLDDGYGTDGGSYHSDEEDGSREITPAFETYRERGMESKAIQTQLLEGEETTSFLGADGIRSGASDATHTTFVGRTVVDHDGKPMELEGAAPQTEEAFLAADMTENAFLNLKYANTNELADRLADTDVPSMTSSSPVFESTGFTFTRQPSFVHQQVPPTTVSASVESSNRGRELSSHESMVEDLVAPRYTFSTPVPYRESAATLVAGGRTNGMVFQPHLQPESQPNRGDSPRSSPAPEAIMT